MKMSDDDCRQLPPFMSSFLRAFMFSGAAAFLFFISLGICHTHDDPVPFCICVGAAALCGLPWSLMVFPFFVLLSKIGTNNDALFMLPASIFFSSVSRQDEAGFLAVLLWIAFFGILGAHINGMIYFRRKNRK